MFWLCLVVVTAAVSCSDNLPAQLKRHDKVVGQALKRLVFPGQAEFVCGTNIDHVISAFNHPKISPELISIGYFGGRYKLMVHIPISIDYLNCKFIDATGPIQVTINEIVKVDFSASGTPIVKMKGQWRLTQNQWEEFVIHHYDWSLAKIPILTNAPVDGFDQFVRHVRNDHHDRLGVGPPKY